MPKRDTDVDQSIFRFSDKDYLTLRDLFEGAMVPGEVGAGKTKPKPPRRRNRAKAR